MPLLAPVITTTLSSMFDVTILLFPFTENSSVSDSHSRSSWNTDVPTDVWLGWNFRYLIVISDYMRIGPRRGVLGFNVVGCRLMKEGLVAADMAASLGR